MNTSLLNQNDKSVIMHTSIVNNFVDRSINMSMQQGNASTLSVQIDDDELDRLNINMNQTTNSKKTYNKTRSPLRSRTNRSKISDRSLDRMSKLVDSVNKSFEQVQQDVNSNYNAKFDSRTPRGSTRSMLIEDDLNDSKMSVNSQVSTSKRFTTLPNKLLVDQSQNMSSNSIVKNSSFKMSPRNLKLINQPSNDMNVQATNTSK